MTRDNTLSSRLSALGYESLKELFLSEQTLTYAELRTLLDWGRPIDVIVLQLREFPFTVHAKLALVREFHLLLPDGLPEEREGVFKVAKAYAHWLNFLSPEELGPKKPRLIEAWSKIKALAPADWLPKSIDDPVIEAAFQDLDFEVS